MTIQHQITERETLDAVRWALAVIPPSAAVLESDLLFVSGPEMDEELSAQELDGLCRWSVADERFEIGIRQGLDEWGAKYIVLHELAHVELSHVGIGRAACSSDIDDVMERQANVLVNAWIAPLGLRIIGSDRKGDNDGRENNVPR